MKTAVIAASLMLLMACGQSPAPTKEQIAQDSLKRVEDARVAAIKEASDSIRDIAMARVKIKLERMWPNDFMTQEMMYNAHLEAYDWIIQVPENPVLTKIQRTWPDDYVTQKMMYEQQLESAERMNSK